MTWARRLFLLLVGPHPHSPVTLRSRPSRSSLDSRAVAVAAFIIGALIPVRAGAQDTHVIVITGVEAGEDDAKQFHDWATALIDAARKKDGVAAGNIVYLADKPAADAQRITARSTREGVDKAFADVAAKARPNDEVLVVLIGHGSSPDGRMSSFNLPGPDLSAADFGRLLDRFKAQRVAFINTASASGGFLSLAAPGRAIVTATKTTGEKNDTRFPQFFVEAFAADAADKNRDGRISIAEAFDYAKTKVAQVYQQAGNLQSEHAVIDDGNEGAFAGTLFLESSRARVAALAASADPELRKLLEEKQALEDQIGALKLRKTKMDAAEYDAQLEKLVTDLALKTRAIQQREGKK
jgi:hypothetical protein